MSYTLLNEEVRTACQVNPDLLKALENVQLATSYTERMPSALSHFESKFNEVQTFMDHGQIVLIHETLADLKQQYLYRQH